jgi:chemotaxis protein methyltransferase CheR
MKDILLNEVNRYYPQFVNYIQQRLGIVIRYQVKTFINTIYEACLHNQCQPQDYLLMLQQADDHSPILEELVSKITIGETYFFRDKNQMRLLDEVILPQLIAKHRADNDYNLRIWSAGCSSGEEIYTIAMMLIEKLPDIDHWQINLLGTDINMHGLQKARLGDYKAWSMRAIDDYYKNKYFIQSENNYQLRKNVLQNVNFSYLNLKDLHYPAMHNGTNAQDLLLCRNVLIYFDDQSIKSLMKRLTLCLKEGGYLILGASDPVHISDQWLSLQRFAGSIYYQRCAEKLPVAAPAPIVNASIKVADKISTSKLTSTMTEAKSSNTPVAVNKKATIDQRQIEQLLKQSDWHVLLNHLEQYTLLNIENDYLLHAKALCHANMGDLSKALLCCKESIKLNTMAYAPYLTLAMILSEQNQINEAELALRKVLYLKPQLVIGHFQLGLLLIRSQQISIALKSFNNALSIAKHYDPLQAVEGCEQMTYGQLVYVLEKEIKLYSKMEVTNHD